MQDTDNIQVLPPSDDEQRALLKRRDSLPKFALGNNEGFYISRAEIKELNDSYRKILDDMEAGGYIPEELRSYMESVIFVSYVSDIQKKQRENYLECEVERERLETLNSVLTPMRWRKWYWPFRLHRNQAQILLDELVNRLARSYYYKKESELPVVEEVEAEFDPYEVQLETLREYLPRMRKKKRAILEEIISGLAASYESKQAKLQSVKEELQSEKVKVEELTAEAKKEAVKRLLMCLSAIKEAKKPADWEILKLRRQLEEGTKDEEPPAEDEEEAELEEENDFEFREEQADAEELDEDENWDDLDKLDEDDEGELE